MSAADLLLVVMRWAHGLATIVWLGGGAYSTLIQGRQLRKLEDQATAAEIGRATGWEFGRWVNAATIVFIVSGVILTVDRLASRGATVQYGIVLALKVGLALWMFGIAQGLARRRRVRPATGRLGGGRRALGSPRTLLWLGAIVVLLSSKQKTAYEIALRTP